MPKIVDRDEMKQKILDAALRMYSEKGYSTATIADIAEAAGLGKGTLYLYFKNKEALAEAMVDSHFTLLAERAQLREAPTSLAGFIDNIDDALKVDDQQAQFIRVFFEIFGPRFINEEFQKRVAAVFDELGGYYAEIIKALQDKGEVHANLDPNLAGRTLAGMTDGLILHRGLLGVASGRYDKLRKEAIKIFLRGLAA